MTAKPDPASAYREFQATLRRYLARRLASPENVEDVLQDVFLRVVRNRKALASTREPLAWLHAVARSALIDHLRRRKKHEQFLAADRVDDIRIAESGDQPIDFAQCLAPLIDGLPEKYRDAIRFVDIGGGKQTELVARAGLSIPAAKSRVQRGRARLKSAIMECCAIEGRSGGAVGELIPDGCARGCC